MAEEEIWKDLGDVKGLEEFRGYYISTFFRFCDNRKGKAKILSQSMSNGYLKVNLRTNKNVHKQLLVHRLIAITFIPNPDNLPEVNHIDENKINNSPSNLEWCTRKHNVQHSFKLHPGRWTGEDGKNAKLTEKDVIEIYELSKENKLHRSEIASRYNVSEGLITGIQRGVCWKHITSKLGPILKRNYKSKLTEKDVIEIYGLLKENKLTIEEIASMYNVKSGTIKCIQCGSNWKHVISELGGPINREQIRYRKIKDPDSKINIRIFSDMNMVQNIDDWL